MPLGLSCCGYCWVLWVYAAASCCCCMLLLHAGGAVLWVLLTVLLWVLLTVLWVSAGCCMLWLCAE